MFMENNMIKHKVWVLILVILAFLLGVSLCLVGILVVVHPTNRVIETWKQPDDIAYNDFGPYYLSVVESSLDISHLPFAVERQYYLYVGADSGKPVYGHVIDFSFHPDTSHLYDLEEFIKMSNVTWSSEGVTFEEASGHKLYIPRSMLNAR